MTLTELAEHFCSVGDPTRPTSGALLNVLKKQSADGVAPSTERKFEVCMPMGMCVCMYECMCVCVCAHHVL